MQSTERIHNHDAYTYTSHFPHFVGKRVVFDQLEHIACFQDKLIYTLPIEL